MKRTVEIVLTFIGSFVYFIGAVFGGSFIALEGNQELINEMISQTTQDLPASQVQQIEVFYSFIGVVGWIVLIGSVLCIIIGIVAMFMLRGNKMPKPAGIILITVGTISILVTFGAGFFAGVFYIIAGIMGIVRKEIPQSTIEQY
ncbi:Protein of unknown function [Gracilibacillus ureilyticus]|uniref:DUF4064 domain-containing protein n=1 Tax=Gracilibacillus ureilyticus TaxID=531814 RepID=A0A1H9NLN5_9BACI|nr:DUF4064 domain-containing protein [Gracilibacillus ureilyticus]SER36934.1 Protein of unknown function [Gracilibacillus ureilyticus]